MIKALLLELQYIDPCIYRLWRVHFRIRHPNSEIIIFEPLEIKSKCQFSVLSDRSGTFPTLDRMTHYITFPAACTCVVQDSKNIGSS